VEKQFYSQRIGFWTVIVLAFRDKRNVEQGKAFTVAASETGFYEIRLYGMSWLLQHGLTLLFKQVSSTLAVHVTP
jgi:hypothetical protein